LDLLCDVHSGQVVCEADADAEEDAEEDVGGLGHILFTGFPYGQYVQSVLLVLYMESGGHFGTHNIEDNVSGLFFLSGGQIDLHNLPPSTESFNS
jgi:hypothetical protein